MRVDVPATDVPQLIEDLREVTVGNAEVGTTTLDQVSSWAVYPSGDDDHAPTDQELLQSRLTTSVVLMGANWGSNGAEVALLDQEPWANFHTDPTPDKKRFPHRTLRRVIGGFDNSPGLPDLQGCYMSDVVKLVSTPDARGLRETLMTNPAEADRCAHELRQELEILAKYSGSGSLAIIACGYEAYRLLLGGRWSDVGTYPPVLAETVEDVTGRPAEHCVRYARHYSDAISRPDLQESLQRALDRSWSAGEAPDFVEQGGRIWRHDIPLPKRARRGR